MYKQALTAGTIFGALGVILGAFAAHKLKEVVSPDMMPVWSTGVTYQFYHSFALLATGILYAHYPFRALRLASLFFTLGIILFCGSLYLMILLGLNHAPEGLLKAIGPVTPIGGVGFIAGWTALLAGILKKK